ncbi:hypothetical protein C7B77_08025 [Chamaesiphon polymorphus CCALA 037]|uniref:Uncharacterized protein n=1 Tax=Chamaesiphon polymorphus CCALA 037 TaxID=2107692 RepID=A0A2T1GIG0_9CYAN|nr:hypothetical protein C7B77_08025 [Chamaesiphon polymorphus CCALA 037]
MISLDSYCKIINYFARRKMYFDIHLHDKNASLKSWSQTIEMLFCKLAYIPSEKIVLEIGQATIEI